MCWFCSGGQYGTESVNPGAGQISAPMITSGPMISGPSQVPAGLGGYNPTSQMPMYNSGHQNNMGQMMAGRTSTQG